MSKTLTDAPARIRNTKHRDEWREVAHPDPTSHRIFVAEDRWAKPFYSFCDQSGQTPDSTDDGPCILIDKPATLAPRGVAFPVWCPRTEEFGTVVTSQETAAYIFRNVPTSTGFHRQLIVGDVCMAVSQGGVVPKMS